MSGVVTIGFTGLATASAGAGLVADFSGSFSFVFFYKTIVFSEFKTRFKIVGVFAKVFSSPAATAARAGSVAQLFGASQFFRRN